MDNKTDNWRAFSIFYKNNPTDADVIILFTLNSTCLNKKEMEELLAIYDGCRRDGWDTIFKLKDNGYVVSDPASRAFVDNCKAFMDKCRLPVVASWKVALAMVCLLTPCWINDNKGRIECVFPENPYKRIDSQEEFLTAAKLIMASHGWHKPYLIF